MILAQVEWYGKPACRWWSIDKICQCITILDYSKRTNRAISCVKKQYGNREVPRGHRYDFTGGLSLDARNYCKSARPVGNHFTQLGNIRNTTKVD